MAKFQDKLIWAQVDESSLSPALAKRLDVLRETKKKAQDAQAAFEVQFIAQGLKNGTIPEGFSLAFGHRYGKLSIAKVSAAEKSPSRTPAKPMFRL
jgi:hypothetical protein